jgi:hypothetical protein
MSLVTRRTASLALASLAFAGKAMARPPTVPLVDLPGPGGVFGINGFDLYRGQAVAQRFTVPAEGEFRLARVGFWLMNNSDAERRFLRVQVRMDALDTGGAESMPGRHTIEEWTGRVGTLGWTPVEQFFRSERGPRLEAGHDYWVVAGSRAEGGVDPVWLFAKHGSEVGSQNSGTGWAPGVPQAALTLRVDAFSDA